MFENPFNSFRPPAESKEVAPEKPKNLATYRKGEKEHVVEVDLNDLETSQLQVLADSILEREPDSLLGKQAILFRLMEEAKDAKGDRKKELEEHAAKAKEELYKEVEKIKSDQYDKVEIDMRDNGFIGKILLRVRDEKKLFDILRRIAPLLILTTELDLGSSRLRPSKVSELVDSPDIGQLTSHLARLELCFNEFGPEGAKVLAESHNLRQLKFLGLWGCQIGNMGVHALVNSPNLCQLTGLNLDSNQISIYGARLLANSPNSRQLAYLGLNSNFIEDPGIEALAKSKNLEELKELRINSNGIQNNEPRVKNALKSLRGRGVEVS